jgi:hypothetical protein
MNMTPKTVILVFFEDNDKKTITIPFDRLKTELPKIPGFDNVSKPLQRRLPIDLSKFPLGAMTDLSEEHANLEEVFFDAKNFQVKVKLPNLGILQIDLEKFPFKEPQYSFEAFEKATAINIKYTRADGVIIVHDTASGQVCLDRTKKLAWAPTMTIESIVDLFQSVLLTGIKNSI